MKKVFEHILRGNTRVAAQVGIVVLCIGLIVYFMPREKYTNYSFQHNAPWNHEQIIAELDFVVTKDGQQIKDEQDSIRKHHVPYFNYKENMGSEAVKGFKNYLNGSTMSGYFNGLFNEYVKCLENLYRDGIVSDADAKIIRAGKNNRIVLKQGGKTMLKDAGMFASCSEAYELLLKADTLLTNEALTRMNLKGYIRPNYVCDTAATRAELKKSLDKVETKICSVQKGQRIINKGDIVDNNDYRVLETYFRELQKMDKNKDGDKLSMFFGQVLFVIIGMFMLFAYIYTYRRNIAENMNKFTFTVLASTLFPVLVGVMISYGSASVFILPFAIVPMMLCLFIDHSTALISHTITIMICSVMLGSPYEFVMLQLLAGSSAILTLRELSSRSQMLRCVLITFLTYAIVYMCYELITESDFSKMKYNMYIYFTVSALLMLFVYPMMFLIEKTFGFISNVTLIELSNLNSKLLQRMSQEAPGTFQHSMQVGNLAAEAAVAIGANSLLVRTGALYHDIGKLNAPVYFTENQNGGINPHDSLSPVESAAIIIKHVTDGLAIAEHEHLPKKIKDFICTHHGLSKTGYFYIKYKNEHTDGKIDDELFTYPGPKPSTKEQAILMLADCVEAASHSLKEYTAENIEGLVNKIVDTKLSEGELSLSPMTFQDIDNVKNVFKGRLMAIYHTRISYPSEDKKQ